MGIFERSLLTLAVAGGAFGYGLAVGHWQVFPYEQLMQARRALTGGGAKAQQPRETPPPPPPGLWHRAKTDEAPEMEVMRELADLPYLDAYTPAPEESGVTLYLPGAEDGWNLVVSGHAPHAALVDMHGTLLHEWRLELREAWPDLDLAGREGHATFWRRAHVFPNGDLLAIFDGIGMVRIDRDSQLVWANPGHYHHDLWLDDDGTIYTLSRHERRKHELLKFEGPIQEDFVSVLSPDGLELLRVSVLDSFVQSDYYPLLAFARKQGDILHTNTIERMDGRFAERHPLYAAGNILISLPTINTVAVIDLEHTTVVWALAGLFKFQHQPTILDDGSMLIFDNLGEHGDSRVLELDPVTQEVLWSYRGDAGENPRRFSSYFLGSSARLSGGNTLITESAAGRAFEVDPAGQRVWEYVNPHRGGATGQLIASLLEVVRLDPDSFEGDFAAALAERAAAAPDASSDE